LHGHLIVTHATCRCSFAGQGLRSRGGDGGSGEEGECGRSVAAGADAEVGVVMADVVGRDCIVVSMRLGLDGWYAIEGHTETSFLILRRVLREKGTRKCRAPYRFVVKRMIADRITLVHCRLCFGHSLFVRTDVRVLTGHIERVREMVQNAEIFAGESKTTFGLY
jgi:hypothetical protein